MTTEYFEFPSNLRGCSRLLSKKFDASLKSAGVNLNQFFMLFYLKNNVFINISAMASYLNTERTTIVRNLKPLLRDCYIAELKEEGDDKRMKRYALSEKGETTLKNALPLFEETLLTLSSDLKSAFIQDLNSKIKKLNIHLTL